MQSQGAAAGHGDGDLPSSLPSYIPSSQGAPTGGPTFGYNLLNQHTATSETADTQRQWKTPNQFMFLNADRPNNQSVSKTGGRSDNMQASPSTGVRTMSFQERAAPSAGFQALGTDEKPVTLKLGRQDVTPNSQISAAQFAASTGGLAMDTALLARVSGTDPAAMGSEEIKQIMRTPDLLSIYQKLQEEDDRRQRRLERNRASARVRREKKKGMVETYEGEVSKLESSLNLLKSHTFGAGQAQELASALEYSSGEHLRHALMSKEAKMELMARILGQHSRNTDAFVPSSSAPESEKDLTFIFPED
ncbi:hypothetical protein BBJ29_001348 [Phytophthora kernoviae]|uniref:BZIP domain-containing protein n=1 Tax=Phytophthora kernoviae TaxID=325452 RepID=A0A3F2RU69_9STRA|nr:hypothetical protein BBJ29_001348 [Phytophthora kernoviae]RLN64276.1 hypothetical protein BBP00_00003549 [Phytophthora kernoviae]